MHIIIKLFYHSYTFSEYICEQLGWFGDQDTKTSQEPKLWKNWKIGYFGKSFKKGNYTLQANKKLNTCR